MLPIATPFPHPGARAFLRGTGAPVTILRQNADGTALVRREPDPATGTSATDRALRRATGNTTVGKADLFETREAAISIKKRRKAA